MLKKLFQLDRKLENTPFFYSLNPLKVTPSKPSELIKVCLQGKSCVQFSKIIATSIEHIFVSQLENFSSNIFWDMDYLIYYIASLKDFERIELITDKIMNLNEAYGEKGPLGFSYSHDFIYGFDWHRWVQKDYKARKKIKPFSRIFLNYLETRAVELKELIAKNDQKYFKLKEREKRNPFPFERLPPAEIKLHLTLAQKNEIPLKAWEGRKATPPKEKNYTKIRESFALSD